jgi:hypothetical protein
MKTSHMVVLGLIWLTLFAVLGVGYQIHLWDKEKCADQHRTNNTMRRLPSLFGPNALYPVAPNLQSGHVINRS